MSVLGQVPEFSYGVLSFLSFVEWQQTTNKCRHTARKNPSYRAGGPSISLKCLRPRHKIRFQIRLASASHQSPQTYYCLLLSTEETYPIEQVRPFDSDWPTVLLTKRPVGTSSTITGRHNIEILSCTRRPKILFFFLIFTKCSRILHV